MKAVLIIMLWAMGSGSATVESIPFESKAGCESVAPSIERQAYGLSSRMVVRVQCYEVS